MEVIWSAQGNITVLHKITIYAGSFDNYIGLGIEPNATCELLNGDTLHLTAIYNKGVINVHGSAGLDQITQFSNQGGLTFQIPIRFQRMLESILPRRISKFPQAQHNSGKISGRKLTVALISQDGGGLVAQGGGNLVAQGGTRGAMWWNDQ